MAASLSGLFNFQALASDGDLAEDFRLYTYTAGTTNHKIAYTEATGVTAHTYTSDGVGGQYIATNSRGELPAPLFLTTGGYDLCLKTPAGSTIWTRRAKGTDDNALALDTALRADLVSVDTTTKAAGQIGFDSDLAYPVNTVGARLRRTRYLSDYADSSGALAADAGLISALTDLPRYCDLIIDGTFMLTSGATITNKNNIGIGGKGKLVLTGAGSGAFALQMVGTCDDILFDGFSIVGDNNAGFSQTGIGNNSGQTLSRIRMRSLNVSNINVGLSLTGNSGTCTYGSIIDCTLSDIIGSSSGQGYGVHFDNSTYCIASQNRIFNASRHSIYHGRGSNNSIVNNIVRDHRKDVFDGSFRAAMSISRSTNVIASGNMFIDCYDCQTEISPVTSDTADCVDVILEGNQYINRKNTTAAVLIGEQAVPTSYMARRVILRDNTFKDDYDLTSGSAPVLILNGEIVSIRQNKFYMQDVAGTARFISLGNGSFLTLAADCTDTIIKDNEFHAVGSVLTDVRGIDLDADICGSTSVHSLGPNLCKNVSSEVYLQASLTNTNVAIHRTGGMGAAIASAGTIAIPDVGDVFSVTGTTTITSVSAAGQAGRCVTLIFAGVLTFTDGSNLKLAGNLVTTADDSITLVCDGTNWVETGRSVN